MAKQKKLRKKTLRKFKLSDDDVRFIRKHGDEYSLRALAEKLNVSHSLISAVKNREIYLDVPD